MKRPARLSASRPKVATRRHLAPHGRFAAVLFGAALVTQGAYAQDAQPPQPPQTSEAAQPPQTPQTSVLASINTVEELIVTGRSLKRMQKEVFRAEQAFYDAFNAANSTDDFDIYCLVDAPTGTHIKRRACRARFVDKLEADQARAFLRGAPPPPTFALMQAKGQQLMAEMRTLAEQRPEVLQALMKLANARESYDKERARRCEGRFLFCRRH